jgi:endonuclease III
MNACISSTCWGADSKIPVETTTQVAELWRTCYNAALTYYCRAHQKKRRKLQTWHPEEEEDWMGANDNFTFFSLAVCTSFLQGFFMLISVLISLSNEDLSVQPATDCFAKFWLLQFMQKSAWEFGGEKCTTISNNNNLHR